MSASRSRFSSPKLLRRRRKVLLWKFALGGGALVLLLLALVGLSRIPGTLISKVLVSGVSGVSATSVEGFVMQKLSGSYLAFFPKANMLLYPRHSLEAALLSAFPKISSAEIGLDDFDTLHLTVIERSPAALWCTSAEEAEEGEQCYFLDQTGFLFGTAPQFEGEVFLRVYGGIADGVPQGIGGQVLSAESFRQLFSFILSLKDLEISPTALWIDAEGDYTLLLSGGSKILLSKDEDLVIVRENLESVLASDSFKNGKLEQLDYLDLRFGNKIYFKEK
ncbi:MAG TPA: hypothetical protein VJI74_03710 [Candidatus Paceibacterota bacterium]